MRITITVRLTATARIASWAGVQVSRSSSRMVGSCSPIRMKTSPFSTKITICQVPDPSTRVSELITRGAARPSTIPAVTTDSTPETCSSSAGIQAANGASRDTSTATGGSLRRFSTWTTAHPTTSPQATPPMLTPTKPNVATGSERGPDGAGRSSRDRQPQRHQGRRVVDEALALQDRDHPPRQPEPLCDGGGRDRIRG